ncbi:MAG TPA: MlaD family protein [Burkholderiales bacterium]|nr:MlaD family protein [Burkholderiales bacterium]
MERPAVPAPGIRHLRLKVGVLLALIPVLVIALAVYALYARGVFEASRTLVLIAPDAEGVSVGMPVTFSGFPVGTVSRMDLTENGKVRIELEIREREARWLRTTSVFTLDKALLGAAKIRATSPNMKDPPLPPGAIRELATRDAAQDMPQMIARANSILQNVDNLTKPDSSFSQSLTHLQAVTQRMAGDYGVLEGVTGSPEHARQVLQTVDQVRSLIASLNGVSVRMDGILAKADQRVFAQGGVMDEAQKSFVQLNAILSDARESLKKADAVLANAQGATADVKGATANVKGATANVKEATSDLVALRAEIDDGIAKINRLLDEINRKWPFAHKAEIKTP